MVNRADSPWTAGCATQVTRTRAVVDAVPAGKVTVAVAVGAFDAVEVASTTVYVVPPSYDNSIFTSSRLPRLFDRQQEAYGDRDRFHRRSF